MVSVRLAGHLGQPSGAFRSRCIRHHAGRKGAQATGSRWLGSTIPGVAPMMLDLSF
jgi:hypothetical protein